MQKFFSKLQVSLRRVRVTHKLLAVITDESNVDEKLIEQFLHRVLRFNEKEVYHNSVYVIAWWWSTSSRFIQSGSKILNY